MPPSPLLSAVAELCARASERILSRYERGGVRVSAKPDRSPVTEADLEADRLITQGLRDLTPAIPCVSEESAVPDYGTRRQWPRFWLVDPLDGTKSFIRGDGDFTVNVALIEGCDPVLAVVDAPARGCTYYAEMGSGAWRRRTGGRPMRLRSAPSSGKAGWAVVVSKSHPSRELEEFLGGLRVRSRLKVGSSLKFCMLAEGAADLYPRFGPTWEWDTAAGDCVFRCSGDPAPRSSPLTYNKPSLRNGAFVIGGEGLGF